jgi:PAS domain S-box-containing protein
VVIADPRTGEIVETNRAASEFFGYTSEEFRSMHILDLHPHDQAQRYEMLFERHFDNQPAVIYQFEDMSPVYVVTADGDRIPVEINAWALEDDEHDRESALFKGVFRDISERLTYERQLMQQRDGLEALTQILSHDVRNDLQIVTGFLDELDEYVTEEGRTYLERIRTSANDAVALTETAHEMADEMLSAAGEYRSVTLRQTLRDELDQLTAEHPHAEITVDGSIPATPVVANDMLHSVFRNLLTNAVQHNDGPKPVVRVRVAERADRILVHVADDGPGIADDRTESVFQKGNLGRESEGTGIGLYLVKTLVEGYGGDVWIEANELGGATFVVELQVDAEA